MERSGAGGEIEPDHPGLEYQTKGCELYSVGNRKLLKQRVMSRGRKCMELFHSSFFNLVACV